MNRLLLLIQATMKLTILRHPLTTEHDEFHNE